MLTAAPRRAESRRAARTQRSSAPRRRSRPRQPSSPRYQGITSEGYRPGPAVAEPRAAQATAQTQSTVTATGTSTRGCTARTPSPFSRNAFNDATAEPTASSPAGAVTAQPTAATSTASTATSTASGSARPVTTQTASGPKNAGAQARSDGHRAPERRARGAFPPLTSSAPCDHPGLRPAAADSPPP